MVVDVRPVVFFGVVQNALLEVQDRLVELELEVKAESQLVVNEGVFRVLFEGLLQVLDAVVQLLDEEEKVTPLDVEVRVFRVELDGLVEVLKLSEYVQRKRVVRLLLVRDPDVVVDLGLVHPELDPTFEIPERLIDPRGLQVTDPPQKQKPRVFRVQLDRHFQIQKGLRVVPQSLVRFAPRLVGQLMRFIGLLDQLQVDHSRELLLGLAELPGRKLEGPEVEERRQVVLVDVQRRLEATRRVRVFGNLFVRDSLGVEEGLVGAVAQPDGRLVVFQRHFEVLHGGVDVAPVVVDLGVVGREAQGLVEVLERVVVVFQLSEGQGPVVVVGAVL